MEFIGKRVFNSIRKSIKKSREEAKRRRMRPYMPCYFDRGVTEQEFHEIVEKETKRIKRIIGFERKGSIVWVAVESQSKISEWTFKIDFNNYGHVTGKYWLSTDNEDSDIPERIAERIKNAIQEKVCEHYDKQDDSERDF